jgi:cytochrome b561
MRRNTPERWGSISIALHWTTAALILLVQVPAGVAMLAASPGRLQNVLFNLHKNTGLVIFLLALVRLSWRWSNPVPALPEDLPGWQAAAARVTHGLLYALLFLMPISGFLYTALGGFPVPFLMLVDLARLVPVNKPLAEVFKLVHLGLQWVLYALVLLHVAGALQHHLIRRDHVLRRMLSSVRPLDGSTGR